MNSKPWRSPAFGLIAAGATVEVAIALPLDLDEDLPLLVSWPRDSGLQLIDIQTTSVKVQNPTAKALPFAVVFTKRQWATLAFTDWRSLLARVRAAIPR